MMKRRLRTAVFILLFIFGVIIIATVAGGGGNGTEGLDAIPVPEPASILLIGIGLVGLAGLGRKKFKK